MFVTNKFKADLTERFYSVHDRIREWQIHYTKRIDHLVDRMNAQEDIQRSDQWTSSANLHKRICELEQKILKLEQHLNIKLIEEYKSKG